MSKESAGKELEAVYALPRVMEIAEVEKIYQDILRFTQKTYKKFTIDAGEVALIDAAGMQLIIQFLLFLRSTGCQVDWINDSVQIFQIAAELGLDGQLEC